LAPFIKNHWRLELVFLFSAVLLSSGMLWMENRTELNAGTSFIGIGASGLPVEVRPALQEITGDLAETGKIETARPRCITIVNKSGTRRTYWFDHETVWCDGHLVIGNVRSFHFEYRDRWGNLLTQGDRDPDSIESVGVAIRIVSRGREVAAAVKVELDRQSGDASGEFASVTAAR
jgi:hypothetical protein